MKIRFTEDSPILIKLVPEDLSDGFSNEKRVEKLKTMEIPHILKRDNTLLLNIDPNWKDFTEHEKEKELNEF